MERKSISVFAAALVAIAACKNSSPTPVSAPSASSSVASPSAPPTPVPEPDFDLSIGEAVELEGTPLPGPSNPTSDALEFIALPKNKIVVSARDAGLASFSFTDPAGKSQTKAFRITEIACRKTPLHPAVLLIKDHRAVIDAPNATSAEVLKTKPHTVAGAHLDVEDGKIRVYADTDGHATILAKTKNSTNLLFDVFVGSTCDDRHYTSIAPAIPPGNVGPKGDGTCQRIDGKKITTADCPDLKNVEKLSKDSFSSLTCDWLAACDVRGHEGCCVGCNGPFEMKVERSCALKALRSKTCADVQKITMTKGCVH